MKLTLSFPELERLLHRMDAPLSNWAGETTELGPRETLLNELAEGFEINLDEVDVGPGGLLTYKGEQVILYIKDALKTRYVLENQPEEGPRFHVAECTTLERMRRQQRFERYVVTRALDGKFRVDWRDPDTGEKGETEAELRVCKNCLKALNWRGYQAPGRHGGGPHGRSETKDGIWRAFTIADFLFEYSTFFAALPSRRDTTAGLDDYVHNWSIISLARRELARWRCEDCGVDLSAYPSLLHCHHRNGIKSDNSPTNLQVLCVLDHAAQPAHGHMKVRSKDKQTILQCRSEQGL